jgi:hypothetical protein
VCDVIQTYEDAAESVMASLNDKSLIDKKNEDKQALLLKAYIFSPPIWLFGLYSEHIILARFHTLDPKANYGDNLPLTDRFFYESLRQQLSMRSGFFCPGPDAFKKSHSCWWTKLHQRVYKRLPKEEKRHFRCPE